MPTRAHNRGPTAADDLFENKNMRAVLKNIEGLSRAAQSSIRGYTGPLIGKKYAKKDPPSFAFSAPPQVVLSGGAGGAYQSVVSGRGNM